MHVFVTGGTGQTGPAVVAELIAAGHTVTGLARSDAAAARLESLGATPLRGSLADLDVLRRGADAADGVLHMAYDFFDPDNRVRLDLAAIEALGRPLEGSGRPLVITSGTAVMPAGRVTTEKDEPDRNGLAAYRIAGEDAALDLAGRGVRAVVVRLAPTVHGPQDRGFISMFIDTTRKAGVSAYVGDGSNRWPAVHRLDAAVLFRLALEKAPAGSVLHGASENVVFKDIAELVARRLGVPTVSLTPEEADPFFENPFVAKVYAYDGPVSSAYTRELLDWSPEHPSLLEDIEHGDYLTTESAA